MVYTSYGALLDLRGRVIDNDARTSAVGLVIIQVPFKVEETPSRREIDQLYMRDCVDRVRQDLLRLNEDNIADFVGEQTESVYQTVLPRIGRRIGYDDMFKRSVQFIRKIRAGADPADLGSYVEKMLPSVYLNNGLGDGTDLSPRQGSRAVRTEYLFYCRSLANIR